LRTLDTCGEEREGAGEERKGSSAAKREKFPPAHSSDLREIDRESFQPASRNLIMRGRKALKGSGERGDEQLTRRRGGGKRIAGVGEPRRELYGVVGRRAGGAGLARRALLRRPRARTRDGRTGRKAIRASRELGQNIKFSRRGKEEGDEAPEGDEASANARSL